LVIAGWPAIERHYTAVMPQPGEADRPEDVVRTSFATTAIAVASNVVQFNTMLAPDADPKLLDQALAIGREFKVPTGNETESRKELDLIQKLTKQPSGALQHPSVPPQRAGAKSQRESGRKEPGIAVLVQNGVGELEVASNDGQHVIVAANSGFSFSDNFGATWTLGGGTPCNQAVCDGDPSLAVGRSGAIYYSWIGGPDLNSLGDGVSRSTDNGHTFAFRGLAANCPGTTTCTLADQEHIAADRNNAAGGGGDRVYNVWRDFAPTFSIRISCSSDGGGTWTAGAAIGAGDLPRVSVGGDGFVYVAWPSGGNMMLHKFSACDAGLTPQAGWPVVVAPFINVACPVPGLDRCNGRNILSSPKVAVDDLDPAHVFYVFATSTGAGNENVMVSDSTDGGATFPRSVRVNNAVTARRFMPWIATYGGVAAVSWYDRRTANVTNNDLTRFMTGGVAVRGPNLAALPEIDLSGASDNQCSTWPAATDNINDSESCSMQPQLAGRCSISGAPCDFSTSTCPVGQSCNIGRGFPKYGDYNGNATGAGRSYSAWSSAVPPTSVGGASGTIRVYASAERLPSDFYVRDWNASPNFDNGAQPSTNPVFWATSDVWNQSASTVGTPGPDGSFAGDPPSRAGSNFVFARVSRRAVAASTAPAATVTANFLRGDFGLGSGFVPIGSETVTFAAGDMTKITPAHAWSVPAISSNHLCLAVQIEGPDSDTFAAPSIAGTAPGPADPFIIADNNKAQRNLQDVIGTATGTEFIAVIRNSEKRRQHMRLRVGAPKEMQIKALFDVIGGREYAAADGSVIDLGILAPGARRFLRLQVSDLNGLKEPVPISVYEDSDPPSNGFTLIVLEAPFEEVARRNLVDLAGVLRRVAMVEKSELAGKQAQLALALSTRPNAEAYLAFLTNNRSDLVRIVKQHLAFMPDGDRFGAGSAAKNLWTAIRSRNADQAVGAAISLVERLDAQITASFYMKKRNSRSSRKR
jgi:hypothetical protein